MTYLGNHTGPILKAEKPIKDKAHLGFIASLGCVCTGVLYDVQVHHLLRCPSRHGQYKAGDQHTVGLRADLHKDLHDTAGNERKFFKSWGISDPVALANALWEATGDHATAMELIRSNRI